MVDLAVDGGDLQTRPEQEAEPLPEKSAELLRWLHRYWPHRCPEEGISVEQIHRYAGARSLIDMLLYRMIGRDKSEW